MLAPGVRQHSPCLRHGIIQCHDAYACNGHIAYALFGVSRWMGGHRQQRGRERASQCRQCAVDAIVGAQVDATSEAVDELADRTEDSRPSVLIPILKVLVDASTAFTPLHSAASSLLKVVEIFEVRHCSSLVVQSSPTACMHRTENSSEQTGHRSIDDLVIQPRHTAPGPSY